MIEHQGQVVALENVHAARPPAWLFSGFELRHRVSQHPAAPHRETEHLTQCQQREARGRPRHRALVRCRPLRDHVDVDVDQLQRPDGLRRTADRAIDAAPHGPLVSLSRRARPRTTLTAAPFQPRRRRVRNSLTLHTRVCLAPDRPRKRPMSPLSICTALRSLTSYLTMYASANRRRCRSGAPRAG